MISHILRQFVIFSVAAGMLLQPLSVAAQYAYPTYSPTPTPVVAPAPTMSPTPMPTPMPSPSPTPTAATIIDEAADFESTVDFDTTYVAFVEGKGDKSFETVPKLDPSKPEDKAKYDMYKDWVNKAISQAMQDTDLIKPFEAANVHVAVVNDLKAHLLANAEKYELAADFVAKLKEKDFKITSFLLQSTGADGKPIYILLVDESLVAMETRNFAALIVVVTRELQNMIFSGKEFPTPLDQEIAALEATIASLEKVLAGMEAMKEPKPSPETIKSLKERIEAEKANLAALKVKKAAGGATPAPKP